MHNGFAQEGPVSSAKLLLNLAPEVLKKSKLAFLILASCMMLMYALWQRPVRGNVATYTPAPALTDTCYRQPSRSLIKSQQIVLVGESVPLHKAAVRKRLERELSRYLYMPAQARHIAAQARRYFRVIDPILKRNGIPRDFRYVVAVESGFEADVVSRRGATGLWQFMPIPARRAGLKINQEVDERLHLEKSTEAAARYIKLLKRETGSWTGALASYNCGLGRYQRATGRAGHGDFYKLHMCRETGRYVFKVMAVKEVIERGHLYGLDVNGRGPAFPSSRRVRVAEPISLSAFAAKHKTDVSTLRSLNPWLVGDNLSASSEKPYFVLVAPKRTPAVAQATPVALPTAERVLYGGDSAGFVAQRL